MAGIKREPRKNRDRDGGMRSKRKAIEINPAEVDYKNVRFLRQFITERGKILPRRISGATAVQQRQITLAIRRARQLALLPYTSLHASSTPATAA